MFQKKRFYENRDLTFKYKVFSIYKVVLYFLIMNVLKFMFEVQYSVFILKVQNLIIIVYVLGQS